LICLIIFGCAYKIWSSLLCCFFHSPVISSHFVWNIIIINLFSNILSLCSSHNVRDQVSHPYKTTARVMFLYLLNFIFVDSRRQDKRLTEG
jgi:hypothetical protein